LQSLCESGHTIAAIVVSGEASHSPKPSKPSLLRTRTTSAFWLPSPMSSTCGMER
jgi:hypothetical protein